MNSTESAQQKHWCKGLFWCWNKAAELQAHPDLRFSVCLCCRNSPLWLPSFGSDEWVEKEEGEDGFSCTHEGLPKCPLLHLERENPAKSAMGKVPRQECAGCAPPAKAWGGEQWRGATRSQRKFRNKGKSALSPLEKSGLGNVIKGDMGPGMREIHRSRFPFLQQKD